MGWKNLFYFSMFFVTHFCFVYLIVGFGGIAGLFLGISLMSIAEIIFYIGIGVVKNLRMAFCVHHR